MKNNNKGFKVPNDYFSEMENKIMLSFYKNKKKEKRLKILKCVSITIVIVIIGSLIKFLPYNSVNNNIQKEDLFSKLIDSNKKINKTKNNLYSFTDKKQNNISQKQRNISKNIKNKKSINYSEAELNYLEQYIKEDSYELLTNK